MRCYVLAVLVALSFILAACSDDPKGSARPNPGCDDADGDEVCDDDDACQGFDDSQDGDDDGVPDGCDCDEASCGTNSVCSESASGTSCECTDGFEDDGAGTCVATSVDECADGTAECVDNATCRDAAQGYFCDCPEGFEGDGTDTGSGCQQVACLDNNGGCDPLVTCEDSDDGRVCGECPDGYDGDGESGCVDIDECLAGTASECDPLAGCVNEPGSYRCGDCPDGYEGDGLVAGTGCTDVDECADDADNDCDEANRGCFNLDGTFACTICLPGFAEDADENCVADTDQCDEGSDDCVTNASCRNLLDSPDPAWECICNTGYEGDGRQSGTGCTNVDECADDEDNDCDDQFRQCSDLDGSFACGDCLPTYVENAIGDCVMDIDQCADDSHDCDTNATCENIIDGANPAWSCTCNDGYQGDGRQGGTGCDDIDECATGNGGCDPLTTCMNEDGGFSCGDCPSGYDGDGLAGCTDIDECADDDDNDCDEMFRACTNEDGGFSCGACLPGYGENAEGTCVVDDSDQCADPNDNDCVAEATCQNLEDMPPDPGYSCLCPDGYTGDGFDPGNGGEGCIDIDECADDEDNDCDESFLTCVNEDGGFSCGDCLPSYGQCADVDQSMEVDITDLSVLAELIANGGATACELASGDVVGDGALDNADGHVLAAFLTGAVTSGMCEDCNFTCGDYDGSDGSDEPDITDVSALLTRLAAGSTEWNACQFSRSDVVRDGDVGYSDADALNNFLFLGQVQSGMCEDCALVCGDVNGDGLFNLGDVADFGEALALGDYSACEYAASNLVVDGIVDLRDAAVLGQLFLGNIDSGACEEPCFVPCGDLNGDDTVDLEDVMLINSTFSQSTWSACEFASGNAFLDNRLSLADANLIANAAIDKIGSGMCRPCNSRCGDVNDDGVVDITDAAVLGGLINAERWNACQFWRSDVNADGDLTNADAAIIAGAGIPSCAP